VDVTGGGRDSAISRRMSAKRFLGMTTSAKGADGRIEVIVDWKSDVELDKERLNSYRGQLDAYRRHTGAPHAFLVLMTPGTIMAV
jgi:hypothetical protein